MIQPGDDPPFIYPGGKKGKPPQDNYVGQNKGIYQILYERELYVEDMKARQPEKQKALHELRGIQI